MSTAVLTAPSISSLSKEKSGDPVVHGQLHKFLPVPHLPEETEMLPAGPVTFGIEARIFATGDGEVRFRGASIHVFDSATMEEWLRFDWFANHAHYHYLQPHAQTNVVWAFDEGTNGEIAPWAVSNMRDRLPTMLRKAGAARLADKVERDGFDEAALDQILDATEKAYQRTFPGTDMIEPAWQWEAEWKRVHPQFDTYDD